MQSTAGTRRIYILEPFQYLREGLASYISRNTEYAVVGEEAYGVNAIEAINELQPDVLMLNIDLPDIDGFEVIRSVKATYPDMKIVLLNVNPTEERVIAGLQGGADAYCLKQSDPEYLMEALQAVCCDEAWLAPLVARKLISAFVDGRLLSAGETAIEPLAHSGHLNPYGLTEREQKILEMMVDGKSNADMAAALFVSYHTVKADVTNIFQKLKVADRVQAVVRALKENLVPVGS